MKKLCLSLSLALLAQASYAAGAKLQGVYQCDVKNKNVSVLVSTLKEGKNDTVHVQFWNSKKKENGPDQLQDRLAIPVPGDAKNTVVKPEMYDCKMSTPRILDNIKNAKRVTCGKQVVKGLYIDPMENLTTDQEKENWKSQFGKSASERVVEKLEYKVYGEGYVFDKMKNKIKYSSPGFFKVSMRYFSKKRDKKSGRLVGRKYYPSSKNVEYYQLENCYDLQKENHGRDEKWLKEYKQLFDADVKKRKASKKG